MTITFLGTGTSQGVPVIACDCDVCRSIDYQDKRLRSSVHIQLDELNLVIDTGPDFRQQMLRERIQKVDAVLFTHEHRDHIAGMDDIRSFNFKHNMDMPAYAHPRVAERLRKEFDYVFGESSYPGLPRINLVELNGSPFDVGGVPIIPIQVMHYKLEIYGFRIHDFTYITDAKTISDSEIEKIKGSRVVVLNALQRKEHISHMTLDQAVELATEIGAKQTYLTHISHYLGRHRDVQKDLPEGVDLAWDGLKVSI